MHIRIAQTPIHEHVFATSKDKHLANIAKSHFKTLHRQLHGGCFER